MTNRWPRHLTLAAVLLLTLLLAGCPAAADSPEPSPTPRAVRTGLPPGLILPPASSPAPIPPTSIPPTAAPVIPSPTTALQEADGSWERIRAAGKIVVGTAVDYPPFAFHNSGTTADGFDLALMDALARKLGLQVEFQDFAFEGLLSALQLGQIDAAIGAISVTPERSALVDFTQTYYEGEDAVLVGAGLPLEQITSSSDLRGLRVGVQRGSVYETLLRDELVKTGQMPPEQLSSYPRPEDAVQDLLADRLDAVMIDAAPAQEFANEHAGQLRIVARGLNPQSFAIAVPKGASNLQSELDRALDELRGDGTLAGLVERYLKAPAIDVAPPTPSPAPPAEPPATETPLPPTSTPQPPPVVTDAPVAGCLDGMSWVQDLTYDDKGQARPPRVAAGQAFVKAWRVQNAGTCAWTVDYHLVFHRGNVPEAQMGAAPLPLDRTVQPGEQYDLALNLIAPTTPGTYQAFWQLQNAQGAPFGQVLWASIDVPAPTAVPQPTPTTAAAVPTPAGRYFVADRYQVTQGEPVQFSWNVQGISQIYFYRDGENWAEHPAVGNESRAVFPSSTGYYLLRIVEAGGSVQTLRILIYVDVPGSGGPAIRRFVTSPERQVALGECVTVGWEVQGIASRITVFAGGTPIWDGVPASGTVLHCPQAIGYISYAIEASGPQGSVRVERTVFVTQ